MRPIIILLSVATFLFSCDQKPKETEKETTEPEPVTQKDEHHHKMNDPHSYAKPSEAMVTHLDWQLNIDFNAKKLDGVATWTIITEENAKQVIFDSKNLDIDKVVLDDGTEANFALGEKDEIFGSAITVDILPNTKAVSIHYQTTEGAEALMWLDPEQTKGKKQPFLFTQSQAILARTWIPCQDGPGVRYTYHAEVQAPKDLLVCMSASNPQERNETGKYEFDMTQRIPSYLMALVCGDLVFKSVGERTGVYAEPGLIDAAHYELGQMGQMLEKAEGLYGAYRWDRYDVVFLPPSFPFGGMENPRLTFATPTIIAGDRSLTALIAHELAHSWSGNLVTNANWNDFWLNEGFTVYFEQRIMEEVYGRDYSEMLALNSYNGLLEELEDFKAKNEMEDTHLKLELSGRNPDDGLSAIAYDKGYLFLRMLEETYGRDGFDAFLKEYFNKHAFGVMTTEQFVLYLGENLLDTKPELKESALIDEWIYGPGLPANCPTIQSSKLVHVDKILEKFSGEPKRVPFDAQDTSGWSAHEYIYFVANLEEDADMDLLLRVDQAFDFTHSTNNEILGQWFRHVARVGYEPGFEALENFLISVGRRKFLTPVYKELAQTEDGKKRAKAIYAKARPNYHAVSTNTIDELLGA